LHHPTPKFVTTVHFQPLKMQRDAAEDLFGRRHRSTHVANQKSLSQVAINHPPHFIKNQNTTIKWMEMGMKWRCGSGVGRLWGGSLEFRGGAGWLLGIAAAGFGGGGGGRSTATMALRFATATATAVAAAAAVTTWTAMEEAAKVVSAIVVAATTAAMTTAMVMVTEVTTAQKCWLQRRRRRQWRRRQRQWWWRQRR